MLQRPEIGTREHVLLWLAGKPADEAYKWMPHEECPCAVYNLDHGMPKEWWSEPNHRRARVKKTKIELSDLAGGFPRTWGALHDRAREAWG
jgi:hypothetical protein